MAVQVQDIDNGIIGTHWFLLMTLRPKLCLPGEPELKCGNDNVEMRFRTRKEFKGKTFVKGHYADPNCKVDNSPLDNTGRSNESSVSIVLHHGACDMQRQRMVSRPRLQREGIRRRELRCFFQISPHGMQMSTVVIISFHPVFITAVDKAYNIRCMYREQDRTVSSEMEVR